MANFVNILFLLVIKHVPV